MEEEIENNQEKRHISHKGTTTALWPNDRRRILRNVHIMCLSILPNMVQNSVWVSHTCMRMHARACSHSPVHFYADRQTF